MEKLQLTVLAFVLICISSAYSLSCLPCNNKDHCAPLDPESCARGVTTDVCGCCPKCFKDIDEECGGPWSVYGWCGEGLKCLKPPPPPGREGYAYDFNAKGKCVVDESAAQEEE